MSENREILLIYDKQCPACDFYCQLARVNSTVGELKLIDARQDSEVMDHITAEGLDIDQGMVLIVGGETYYGADAIHMLSLLSSRIGIFNRLMYHTFRSQRAAKILYPVLRSCRNLLLKILRKSKINNLGLSNNQKF